MIDHKLRVVNITNNLEKYPEYTDDTKEFPYLVEHVGDEIEVFVVEPDTSGVSFWRANYFFHYTNVREFLVDAQQVK